MKNSPRAETPEAAAHIKRVLRYCDETGHLYWKVTCGRAGAGSRAGNLGTNGHWRVGVLGRYYQAHRIVWLLCTGEWPRSLLDHRDQDMLNNRFGNLREADKSLNAVNTAKVRKGSKTGLQGVGWSAAKGKYRARFRVGGVERLLGYWDDPLEAAAAYQRAKQEYLCTK